MKLILPGSKAEAVKAVKAIKAVNMEKPLTDVEYAAALAKPSSNNRFRKGTINRDSFDKKKPTKMKLSIESLKAKAKPGIASPSAAPASKPASKLTSKPASKHSPAPEHKHRDILYGSGITKKVAEKAATDQKNLQSKTYSVDQFSEDELGAVLDLKMASTLMDANLKLDPDQQAAVDGCKAEKYSVIIGKAGVGKTTVSKAVLQAVLPSIPTIDLNSAKMDGSKFDAETLNAAVCIVSFMGKAVQQIKRALPVTFHQLCGTIHSTLAYAPEKDEYIDEVSGQIVTKRVFRPQFTEHNKLPFQLCIIDEAGTVPVSLFNNLVKALPDNCRFILMGDLNQLPPVTGHSILGFAIIKWPTYELKTLHRNAGVIAQNASRIIDGKKPLKHPENFIIQNLPDSGIDAFQTVVATLQMLYKNNLFNPLEDAFIVPQNIDVLGQIAFNERLVRMFNPTKKIDNVAINPPIIISAGYVHATYAVGDKIMMLANDSQAGLTNGMMGVIQAITPNDKYKGEAVAAQVVGQLSSEDLKLDLSNLAEEISAQEHAVEEAEESERQASHTVSVKFQNVDELTNFSTAGRFKMITHSYAMTCHKAQGSEYETVVVVCHSANARMLYREWLYTAITRAKTRVILLCNQRGLVKAINKQLIKGNTMEEKAKKFTALSGKMQDDDAGIEPMLCAPEKV